MIDKIELHEKLTNAFIRYQYQLENPMTSIPFNEQLTKYHTDPIFKSKVRSLVSGVMYIISDVEVE